MSLQRQKNKNFKPNYFKFFTNSSIVLKVTLWYTVFIIIIITVLIAIAFTLAENLTKNSKEDELVRIITSVSENNDLEKFDKSMCFIIYDKDHKPIKSNIPKGFNPSLPLREDEIREYTNQDKQFVYYDLIVDEEESKWVRGIIPIQPPQEIIFFIMCILAIVPVIVALIIYGGYIIIKRAFGPISDISKTALDIKKDKDFSKRIETTKNGNELHQLASTFNQMLDSLESSYNHEKQFSRDVSHELRTPITVILSESEYGVKYADTFEEAKESLNVIYDHSKRMRNLINQIMKLSKIEQNHDAEKKIINLSSLLSARLDDYKYILDYKNIILHSDIETDLYINGNKTMIESLLDNLISNAIKFTNDYIKITLKKHEENIECSIEDNGIGIPKDKQELIWNRFYQIESSRNKEENKGSGLGLSLVQKILEIHNGEIHLQSEEGKGAKFTVTLKLENKNS